MARVMAVFFVCLKIEVLFVVGVGFVGGAECHNHEDDNAVSKDLECSTCLSSIISTK
jgi:hypothetical protein